MKQHKTITIVAIILFGWIFRESFTNHLIGFLLTGALPGSSLSLPYWFMLLLYIAAIIGIIVFYINHTAGSMKREHHIEARKATMPRRRYGSI